jgi:DNA-binding transcriptional ArsR family regulator
MVEEDRSSPDPVGDSHLHVLAEAMAHRFRSRIFGLIAEKPGLTVRQISAQMGEPARRVRHHLEALLEAGLVMVESEARTRNTVERHYRATRLPIIEPHEIGVVGRFQERRISLEVFKQVFADVDGAVARGTFGVHGRHSEIRVPTEVDEQGWEDLFAIHIRAWEETRAALDRCEERLRDSGSKSFRVTSAFLLFETPGWED